MKAGVYYNQILAGYLEKMNNQYVFEYSEEYLKSSLPSISFSLPKQKKPFESAALFPFFSGLLSEGYNKSVQCRFYQIHENDEFTRLLKTAHTDTIGAITVREI